MIAELSTIILLLLTNFYSGNGQNVNDTINAVTTATIDTSEIVCSPLNSSHGCFALAGRNTQSAYPQVLFGDTTQQQSARTVELALQLLTSTKETDAPGCNSLLTHSICIVSRPPCNEETGLLLPVCPDSCRAYNRLIADDTCDDIITVTSDLNESPITPTLEGLNQVLAQLDCSSVETYYFYENVSTFVDRFNCTEIFSIDEQDDILSEQNRCELVPTQASVCDNLIVSFYGRHIPANKTIQLYLLKLIDEIAEDISNETTYMLLYLACFVTLVPCDPDTGDVLALCLDSCDTFNLLKSNFSSDSQDIPSDLLYYIERLNCSNPFSYIQTYIHVDGSQCIDAAELLNGMIQIVPITMPTIGPATPNASTNATTTPMTEGGVLVGTLVAGGLIVLAIVAVIVTSLCIYRKKSKRDKLDNVLARICGTRSEREYIKENGIRDK